MNEAIEQCRLADYGVLRFSGPDAQSFLQGQLSNDMGRAQGEQPLLAGLHTPQGRTLALLRLWRMSVDAMPPELFAALPAELLTGVEAHLRRFVLRTKVTIAASDSLRVWGQRMADGALTQVLRPPHGSDATPESLSRDDWEAGEIAAGIPEIHTATAAEFVAQMLNLDCIDGIAWDKGCYTGQEIIARAHYRGQVKRRMRRYVAATAPPPGSVHRTSDGIEVRVVRSVQLDGGCELLGVAPLELQSVDERPMSYALPKTAEIAAAGGGN